MSNLLTFDHTRIRDISREPKVTKKNAPRDITHTITLVPSNFVKTLWRDIEPHLAKAVARSKGRWEMEALYYSLENNK